MLRDETNGGLILLVAAAIALIWANSPWSDSYHGLAGIVVGPAQLHLDLSLASWAADGLLAVFFFVVGLELKREFVAGDLRDLSRAVVPILGAVGGMVAPALIFVAINLAAGSHDTLVGWAVPTATDIAFAVAVLAVLGSFLPPALRIFLLTLAVVDDLLAITIIAFFYTDDLALSPLLWALIPFALFAIAVQRGLHRWWILLPLAVTVWALVHASGIHATVAGVALGFTVPVLGKHAATDRLDERCSSARKRSVALDTDRFEHLIRPFSAGVAIPVFAFFAAGVTVGGLTGLLDSLSAPVTIGVLVGLVAGKPIGIFGATWLLARFTRATLDAELTWRDVFGVTLLAGIGFTVSLLIGELAFGYGSPDGDHVKVGVFVGSLVAAGLAAIVLGSRNRAYRRIAEADAVDADDDGIPDVYQKPTD
ncbi:hypothetical protein MBRU_06235 [Mycolicibacterium brumae DSM 44177]|nr:hypothetical protein MBRU_06235 [Mycolicibacterium brumae DSM 44177]